MKFGNKDFGLVFEGYDFNALSLFIFRAIDV
jgi:hypothetical protein